MIVFDLKENTVSEFVIDCVEIHLKELQPGNN